jgi:CrcB protein
MGGAFGGISRYLVGRLLSRSEGQRLPVGTFAVNIAGAFLLGLLTSVNPEGRAYLLLGDGFLGAFTTFSTFMYEGFHLLKGGERKNAAAYIGGSLVVGLAGYALGYTLGRSLF